MYYKTEPTRREIIFDIYDVMTAQEVRKALSDNFNKLEQPEKNKIISLGEPIWLLRKSRDTGVLTIEYMQYDWNQRDFTGPTAVRSLQLTKKGWQTYDPSYKGADLLEINQRNINAIRLSELEEIFKNDPKYKRENMVYPEMSWAIQKAKANEQNAKNTHHGMWVRPCPDEDKGILRRLNSTNSQSVTQPNIHEPLPVMISQFPVHGAVHATQSYKQKVQDMKEPELRTSEQCAKYLNDIYNKMKKDDIFEFLHSYRLPNNANLEEILKHALADNSNRTSKLCVKLGWLTENGQLGINPPDAVRETFNKLENLDQQSRHAPGNS
ncbi:hypothetical protein ACNVED_08255 [Legionella sp. D16C41]|uniref:hypothetical protein n=1 Tax=Legionella sp. D16C41 TaxID=3402688 RepID=UPI003AF6A8F5